MKTLIAKNWVIGSTREVLNQIHEQDVNIAIYTREVSFLSRDVEQLIHHNIELNTSGAKCDILTLLKKEFESYPALIQDVESLISLFEEVSQAQSFRLLLATINTNMCRRFHTDVIDLRLLCTYYGPGTLWLKEENVNRTALETCKDNECIVLNPDEIQQVATGAVVILKGSIYPHEGTKAIVHRSPTIEESGERRLLLRIDTNEFLNFM
ncbi:MAG: DUF1826 domain-containing protein [Thermaurantimonas sp.]